MIEGGREFDVCGEAKQWIMQEELKNGVWACGKGVGNETWENILGDAMCEGEVNTSIG